MPEAALDRMNTPPAGFDPTRDLPAGFAAFYAPLHAEFTPRQRHLRAVRGARLQAAHRLGELPEHRATAAASDPTWRIELPTWCADQRNQMTGPADDAELVVKMLNSGAPGVMLDLEDSMANAWPNLMRGVSNILGALHGTLSYLDRRSGRPVGIAPGPVVVWSRVRGLHLSQAGVTADGVTSASLFDLALLAFQVSPEQLRHPFCVYLPKNESADEGAWWRDVFRAIEDARGWPRGSIRCMALVESHPLAYEMEEFLHVLREHIVGLNLGRWDYMASLIHWNLADPRWVLPDRNTIAHDVPFFQNLRQLLVDICHRRGALAIGGMTALYPSRTDAALNARALETLERDKRNESACGMDGAWTGHPDQNAIAVAQFPAPNQLGAGIGAVDRHPDLRPAPVGVGTRTVAGTRAAARTVIRYRHGVLSGRGASLLDGYMEDLATDRIYRLMLAQRRRHHAHAPVTDAQGAVTAHDDAFLRGVLDEECERLIAELPADHDAAEPDRLREACAQSWRSIAHDAFDPI